MMEFNVSTSYELHQEMKKAGYDDQTIGIYTEMFDNENDGTNKTVTVSSQPN